MYYIKQTDRIKASPGKVFRAIASAFSSRKKQVSPSASRLMLVQLPSNISFEDIKEEVNDRISLYLYIGFRVQIARATEEIPDGYICKASCFDAGKLIYQEHWKIQVEYVEKKSTVAERISQPVWPSEVTDLDNILILDPIPPHSVVMNPYLHPHVFYT